MRKNKRGEEKIERKRKNCKGGVGREEMIKRKKRTKKRCVFYNSHYLPVNNVLVMEMKLRR